MPPVGDQGQYGTCIGWSSGYYNKTMLEAVALNYTSSQLSNPGNQMSAKDLFTAIADADKGANCDGTSYGAALTVEQNRGVATLATVPYTNLSTCSQGTLDPSWATDAANHTIKNFRALGDASTSISDYITAIKQTLVTNTPVMIPISVGAGFQNWTGSGVMTAGFDPCGGGGTCGGHAQTIVGYDDTKGTGGAFRIVNSWNTTWGDQGFYWVDYNFLFNTLAEKDNNGNYGVYAASNGTSNGNDTVAPPNQLSGIDLAAWVQEDDNTGTPSNPTRQCIYNIYNIGTQTAPASAGWGLYYVYYNAFNANDYGVIFYDAFTNSIGLDSFYCSYSGDSCEFNLDIPAGSDFAYTAFGTGTLYQDYTMPNITGSYYLILIANAGEVLNDVNYSNNIFYTSDYYGNFTNGYLYGKKATQPGLWPDFNNPTPPNRQLLRGSSFNTAVTKSHPNAYTPKEIIGFLKQKKASGDLDAKVRERYAAGGQSKGGVTHK